MAIMIKGHRCINWTELKQMRTLQSGFHFNWLPGIKFHNLETFTSRKCLQIPTSTHIHLLYFDFYSTAA